MGATEMDSSNTQDQLDIYVAMMIKPFFTFPYRVKIMVEKSLVACSASGTDGTFCKLRTFVKLSVSICAVDRYVFRLLRAAEVLMLFHATWRAREASKA